MKKILLATTALVGFAGAASAEVSISGYAEMGIAGGNAGAITQFWTDANVTFAMSGTTDGGLEFGAKVDLDSIPGNVGPGMTQGGESIWISGSFGKITMGDTDGALDWAVSEIYMGTAIADDHSSHAGAYWNSGLDGSAGGQIARYEYSFGSFAAAVSAEIDSSGAGNNVLGVGVKYSSDMGGTAIGFGLGYQDNSVTSMYAVSANATMTNGIAINVGYADLGALAPGANDTWAGVGLGYTSGALMVQGNYGTYSLLGGGSVSGFGVVANYDLGGGAVVMAGYGSGDLAAGNEIGGTYGSTDTFSVGLGLSF
ncbi:MAG: porin [Pseudorhodobacter sp.]|nr:porin [Pseudorhodobacter sp.]